MSKNIKIGNKIFTDVEYISCKGAEQDGVQRKYVDVDSVPETQEKSVTITESGTSEVTPDEGKVLSKVTVIAEINTGDNEHYTGETTINPSADSDTVLPTANKIVDSDITVKKIGKPFIDSSKLTDLSGFFQQGRNNPDILIENMDTSNVTNMSNMFNGFAQLTTVPLFDTSKVTNMSDMFNGCRQLTTVPLFDTSNVGDMTNMFRMCTKLTTVPLFDTSKVVNMYNMFNYCTQLTTVPLFNTSNVVNMSGMFSMCAKLTTVPLFNTSKVVTMYNMFGNCTQLTTVPLFDTSNVGNMDNMFNSCAKLTEVWIKNIKVNLQVGSGTSWGHLLTVDSLVHLCQELVNVGSSRTLTVGSANLTKLASVYVKLTVPEAEDTTGKLPCEVCESTDEGAMLIEDYIALKHWQLA